MSICSSAVNDLLMSKNSFVLMRRCLEDFSIGKPDRFSIVWSDSASPQWAEVMKEDALLKCQMYALLAKVRMAKSLCWNMGINSQKADELNHFESASVTTDATFTLCSTAYFLLDFRQPQWPKQGSAVLYGRAGLRLVLPPIPVLPGLSFFFNFLSQGRKKNK